MRPFLTKEERGSEEKEWGKEEREEAAAEVKEEGKDLQEWEVTTPSTRV